MERLQKQRAYGTMASARNLEMIRLKNMTAQVGAFSYNCFTPLAGSAMLFFKRNNTLNSFIEQVKDDPKR